MTVRPITIDFETESHNIITDIKHGKGIFTYRIDDESQSGQVISLPEINNSIYLDLYVQYYWTNSSGSNNSGNNNYNTCNLKLNWMPRYSDNTEYINELSPEFNQINNIKIQFNNESLISVNKSLKISDPESEPGWQGQVSFDGSESKRNIEIRFTYEYTNNGVTYYVSGLNDTYSLKIFPPSSKYARNVVFNEEGINELVGYFKQYPITKLENGEKYGHIKITKGIDEESEVSPKGLENSTEDLLLCSTDFSPSENNSFDLGTSNIEYKQLYSSQPVHFDSETGIYSSSTTFSTEGLNEIIAVEGNCTIISTYREDSQGEHQITKIYSPAPNVSTTVQDNSIIIEWYGNRPPAPAINGGKTRESMMSNFRVSITTRKTDVETNNLYWRNLYLSDTLYANELKGKYTGLPAGEEGEIININDKFIVDNEGNVHMAGNLSWGKNGVDTIQAVYHPGVGENRTIPPTPENGIIDFPDVSTTDWHFNYNSNNDYWMSFSFNGGETWNNPMKVQAEDGKPGPQGGWSNDNILQALQSINSKGIFTFDNTDGTTKLGINTDVILAGLIGSNRIEIFPEGNYSTSANTANMNVGGYISFAIPNPLGYEPSNNAPGWRARLGYLQGTADGTNATAGIGLAIYTRANWTQWSNTDQTPSSISCIDNTSLETKHLLLASLMLTQSGLGLLVAENIGPWSYTDVVTDPLWGAPNAKVEAAKRWCNYDCSITDDPDQVFNALRNYKTPATDKKNSGHYRYRWWNGQQDNIVEGTFPYGQPRYYRLWIDSNNGMLYYHDHEQHILKPWLTPSVTY